MNPSRDIDMYRTVADTASPFLDCLLVSLLRPDVGRELIGPRSGGEAPTRSDAGPSRPLTHQIGDP
jgi:hypothetical protein